MEITNIPEYDVIPTGRGVHIECWHPAPMCSIACMKNMRGLTYKEIITASGDRKTIDVEQWHCCNCYMAQGLYYVASNICRACRMHEQASR